MRMGMAASGNQSPHAPPEWIGRKQGSHASGNGCKWEWVQVGIKARTRRRVDRPNVSARPRTHTRTGPLARVVALDPYQWSGVVGNNTTLPVALAAGFGGAFALLLVVVIVMILRNRRAARAVDPAPGLRTPLYLE
jgi:hypothetical protein